MTEQEEKSMIEPKIVYRKTREGDWAAFGPAFMIKAGHTVTVTKADGSRKQEKIARVSKPFDVNGVPFVYGYIERARKCDNCGEFRGVYLRRDSSGLLGYVCYVCNNDDDGYLSFG
jgi:hypothetical protein